jgi:hypothetical protein
MGFSPPCLPKSAGLHAVVVSSLVILVFAIHWAVYNSVIREEPLGADVNVAPSNTLRGSVNPESQYRRWETDRPTTLTWIDNLINRPGDDPLTFHLRISPPGDDCCDPVPMANVEVTSASGDMFQGLYRGIGDLHINFDVLWGWYALSPDWSASNQWNDSPTRRPLTYSDPVTLIQMAPDVALLIAGDNTPFPNVTDQQVNAVCNALHDRGIKVYAVAIDPMMDLSSSTTTLMQQCTENPATDFFTVTSRFGLDMVGAWIANRLALTRSKTMQ